MRQSPSSERRLEVQKALCPELDVSLYESLGWQGPPTPKQATEALLRAAVDPAYFIFGGFCRTFDEHDRDHPVKPFPDKTYLREALHHIHPDEVTVGDVSAINKSRQIMITWLLCAYACWEAHFHAHRRVMMQTKKAEDAWNLVYRSSWMRSRCSFIERAMPEFMRAGAVTGRAKGLYEYEGALEATRGTLSYPNGSEIMGIPQGEHMFRSYTASLVICDECCFQPEFEEAYAAALPMAKGGGRIILVSTALAGTYYAKLVEEDEHEEAAA